MASESGDFDKKLESLKTTVKTSFARIYASLKARELQTLRQLDALSKQCQGEKELSKNCIQNIIICFDNESELIYNIRSYGAIDLENFNFDGKPFSLEDYVSPEDDHIYSYKTLQEATKEISKSELEIEEAALKEITATNDCECYVSIKSEDVSQKFRDVSHLHTQCAEKVTQNLGIDNANSFANCGEVSKLIVDEEKSLNMELDPEIKKLDPTDDWMNTIKSQTETEPTEATDLMEHSTIVCS